MELFRIIFKKDKITNGYGKLDDSYLYLSRNGKKLYQATLLRQLNTIFGSLPTSESNVASNGLSENEIRE